jgi:glycerophosphoryl diester phosphodiesterase
LPHPFLTAPTPLVIAHRGASQDAPENTLAAFQAAIDLGCRYLETDVHVTRDGVVVAFHDHELDRVTDRSGAIEALPMAEVAQAKPPIPRLEEILARWPDARVNIDPKTDRAVDPLVGVLDRLNAWDRVCIGAFSDRRLARIRRLHPGACTSMGPAATATALLASRTGRMPRLGADCVQVPPKRHGVPIVSERFVRAAHRARLPVHVWTIDDEPTMHRLLDLGVDAIMTNRPRALLEVIAARTAAPSAART